MLISILAAVSVAAYLAATLLSALPALRGTAPSRAAGLAVAAVGVLAHLTYLLATHRGGVDLHFFAALSFVAMLIAGTTLAVNAARPVGALGVIVFPLAAVLLAVDAWLAPPTRPSAMDWQIKLHVVVALFGYALLSVSAVLALLLLVQERALRNRDIGSHWLRVLPPLTLTESLMFRLVGAGFVLLTATLLTGVLFVENLFAQHLVHKTTLSIVAWVVFGTLLVGRWRYGWRGRRAVRLLLSGMAVLLLAFFGSKFVLEVLLARTP
ncbi:MAG TPA: cytochrome c biogenesis protein CcsA [Tahibacter sp.]|uniref:cytochrome C assembly family protein n=1 Tax=Tahibacter sp. TaxID=2056211 RepID=UPI002B76A4A1|nr:cytochrome c biogenesis protein CcsA [Tahibacter sp.]HSX62962.1 cytochrome c biogenesis protein CcsA [Tahibacter sp.]